MKKPWRLVASCALIIFTVAACNLGKGEPVPSESVAAASTATPSLTIKLNVEVQAALPITTVGQAITYTYHIKNTGTSGVPGTPSSVNANSVIVPCPAANTVGNKNDTLDPDEAIICSATYAVTQADLDKGSVTNIAVANVAGIITNQVATTTPLTSSTTLTLTKTASPTTYSAAGQSLLFSYVIKNTGSAGLGPDQFKITDSSLGAAFNCGSAGFTLAPGAAISCQNTYITSSTDAGAASISSTATASGGGQTSQTVSLTIAKSTGSQGNPNPGNLPVGSTVQHKVVDGEWLWQIARCYGTDPKSIIQANPQMTDPDQISPDTVLSVPNIGSAGTLWGPPCVGTHKVQSGETWNSIAAKYNADPTVLQIANANTLTVGSVLTVPLNSASAP